MRATARKCARVLCTRARRSTPHRLPPASPLHHCRPHRVLKQRLLAGRAAPKRVRFAPPLAAIIPGDTVVEQVFTTGIQNFL